MKPNAVRSAQANSNSSHGSHCPYATRLLASVMPAPNLNHVADNPLAQRSNDGSMLDEHEVIAGCR